MNKEENELELKDEQKEFMDNLQKEVNELENVVIKTKKENHKKAVIKNIRVTGKFLRKWVPIITTGIVFSCAYSSYLAKPFQSQPIKANAYIETTQDNLGNIDVLKQYTSFDNKTNYVELHGAWEQNDNGYTRTVKRYYLNEENTQKCLDVLNGNAIDTFESVFNIPNSVVTYESNNLTLEELNTKPQLKLVMYSKDYDDCVVRMTETTEVIGISLLYLMGVLLVELLTYIALQNDHYRCDKKIKEFKEQYKEFDLEPLQKKLELKKEEYNNLLSK